MATLNENANRVLSEFGGRIPAHLLQFEDARREFLQVRALELQKLGISDTDKTVTSKELSGCGRDAALGFSFGEVTPAFVELKSSTNCHLAPEKVEIIPVEAIPDYEGANVIAFYGNPMRYRAGFDFWERGCLVVWYDGVEDLLNITGETNTKFAPAFTTYLVKKAALNLIGILLTNFAFTSAPEENERMKIIVGVMTALQTGLAVQVAEWQREFKKYTNSGLNTGPHLRRTNDEILARGYHNVTGRGPLDFVG